MGMRVVVNLLVIIMMLELKNKLNLKEIDFIIDLLMSDRRDQTIDLAKAYDINVPMLVQKLAGQGDMLEGIYNDFND